MILNIISFVTLISLVTAGAAVGFIIAFSNLSSTHLSLCFAGWLLLETVLLYGIFDRRAPIFGRIFWRGPQELHAISITFDDGPNEPYTSRILDILKAFNIKATFFLIGENVETFPDTVRRALEEGHEIGSHTYNHNVLPLRSPEYIRDQIRKTNDLIERITGVRPKLFRAPHGWRNPWVNRSAREVGCIPVAWTLGVWDTDRPGADMIVQRTLKGLKNGCVLLLHDGRGTQHGTDSNQLVEALPVIIRAVLKAGYKFLALSEMMKETERK